MHLIPLQVDDSINCHDECLLHPAYASIFAMSATYGTVRVMDDLVTLSPSIFRQYQSMSLSIQAHPAQCISLLCSI